VDEFTGQQFEYVITICDHAKEIVSGVSRQGRSTCVGALKILPPHKGRLKNGRQRLKTLRDPQLEAGKVQSGTSLK